jgi:hypothetical protein
MRLYRLFLTGAALAAAVTTISAAPALAAGPAGAQKGSLAAVSGTSPSNIWAVGNTGQAFSTGGHSLIEHWNGARWRVVPSPSPGRGRSKQNMLEGVAAVTANDAWAVGYYDSGNSPAGVTTRALIEHWNGARWTQVSCGACSSSQTGTPALFGITAISRSDVWAVGSGVSGPLLVHWNGRRWSTARLAGTVNQQLTGVGAGSAGNVWATGQDLTTGSALTARWNGRRWVWVRLPHPTPATELNGVVATSRASAWAVGQSHGGQARTVRWNGTRWSRVPGPTVPSQMLSAFTAVTSAPGGRLWAVGWQTIKKGMYPTAQTLTARWAGTKWVTVASPDYGSSENILNGVYVPSAGSAWAVGTTGLFTVIEHWNGRKWSLATP